MKALSPTLRLILSGAFAVLFALATVVYLPHAAGYLAALTAVALLPIPAWQGWLTRILKRAKPGAVAVAAVCVFIFSPTSRELPPTPTPAGPTRTTGTTVRTTTTTAEQETEYVLNRSSKKFHLPHCANAKTIKDENRDTYKGTAHELEENGYTPCGNCLP